MMYNNDYVRELSSRLCDVTDSLIEESAEQFEMDMWDKYNRAIVDDDWNVFVAMLESIVNQSYDNRMKYMANNAFCAFYQWSY